MIRGKHIWIDAEWYINQNIFLLGFAYNQRKCRQLYGKTLTRQKFLQILKPVTGYVFAYGPDIGMTEKHFRIRYRHRKSCINLMKVFRDHMPANASFKLKDLEEKFGLARNVVKYKISIFRIWRDWRHPQKRFAVLSYNADDVINLVKITHMVFDKYKVRKRYLDSVCLK